MSGKMQKVQPLTDVRDYLITENISKIKENRLGKLKGRFKNEKIRKIIYLLIQVNFKMNQGQLIRLNTMIIN